MSTHPAQVILKQDPRFPEYLDFDFLRREGLEHIGKLSGSVWTDHNIHDPGVTILEVLIYALLDLGYRTQLPIEDLLARAPGQEEEDFFSPAQILTNNPTTILDFRKMLIDIPGVKNAWLEVAKPEVPLYLNCSTDPNGESPLTFVAVQGDTTQRDCKLSCTPIDESTENPCSNYELPINGLYKVYIQLEYDLLNYKSPSSKRKTDIVAEVRRRLQQHRNLGEDYTEICVLCEEKLGFCIDLEVFPGTDPELTYVNTLQAIAEFLSPSVPFHSLQEMLDRGKSIEEIFEGRPYGLDSFGFIDTEELLSIHRKKEIHLSDIYQLIMQVEGVKSIRSLELNLECLPKQRRSELLRFPNPDCDRWIHQLPEDFVPILCLDCASIEINSANISLALDKSRINKLWKQVLAANAKGILLAPSNHDLAIPQGRFRPDLATYYSIQNDFPRNYRIQEGGLSRDASQEDRAKVYQLKGYLLFYEQLLAGYLAQLSHVGEAFSMRPDQDRSKGSQQTYFIQGLESIPGVQKLLRFYKDERNQGMPFGGVLAHPVKRKDWECFLSFLEEDPKLECKLPTAHLPSQASRDAVCELFRRQLEQGNFEISIHGYPCYFFFVVHTTYEEMVLLSHQKYATQEDARVAADTMSLMGSMKTGFRPVNDRDLSDSKFTFELIETPIDYLGFLQQITESPEKYHQRRNKFLDHLLARFNEQFTDYSLNIYDRLEDRRVEVRENKARFLSNYDLLSRDRGRAFNYCQPSWNLNNISGFEREVMARLGFANWNRQSLCNFEIWNYETEFQFALNGPNEEVFFRSRDTFRGRAEAENAAVAFWDQSVRSFTIEPIDNPTNFTYSYSAFDGALIAPKHFSNRAERDQKLVSIRALFSNEPSDDDIFVSEYVYRLELSDQNGKIIRRSRKEYKSPTTASKDIAHFSNTINKQLAVAIEGKERLELWSPLNSESVFLDTEGLHPYFRLDVPQYRWLLYGDQGQELLTSAQPQPSLSASSIDLLRSIRAFGSQLKWSVIPEGEQFLLYLQDQKGETVAFSAYDTKEACEAAKKEIASIIVVEQKEQGFLLKKSKAYSWILNDEGGENLCASLLLSSNKRKAEKTWKEHQNLIDNGLTTVKEKSGYRIILKDAGGQIVAQSNVVFAADEIADRLKALKERIGLKNHIQFVDLKSAYAFQLPDPENPAAPLLESYYFYPYATHALLALSKVLVHLRLRKNYLLTGNEADLNYGFFVRDEYQQFIALHPKTYATPEEQKSSLSRSLKLLKKRNPVIGIQTENYFLLEMEDVALMRSERAYVAQSKALEDFHKVWYALREEEAVEFSGQEKKYFFSAKDREGILASSVRAVASQSRCKQTIAQLRSLVADHTFEVTAGQYPKEWRYKYTWETPGGTLNTLFKSAEVFSSIEGATAAYERFMQEAGTVSIKESGNSKEGYQLHYYYKDAQKPFSSSDLSTASAAEKTATKRATTQLLTYIANLRAPLSDQPDRLAAMIGPSPQSHDGNYVYRLLKKDNPVAFHPCICFEDEDDAILELVAALRAEAEKGYKIQEICLGGEVLIQIGLRYHYVIRDKTTKAIFFISYRGYNTEAEALAAFQEQYIAVIDLASDPANYGTAEKPILIGAPDEVSNSQCVSTKEPIVCIPEDRIGTEGYIEEWARCFCTYPIRRCQKKSPSGADCVGKALTYCYYFHIVRPDDPQQPRDCKLAWKSTECYESIAEAWTAFRHFQYLLAQPESYHLFTDETGQLYRNAEESCCDENDPKKKCCQYIVLTEVLIESNHRYQTEEQAWGIYQPLITHSMEYLDLDRLCKPVGFPSNQRDECERIARAIRQYQVRFDFIDGEEGGVQIVFVDNLENPVKFAQVNHLYASQAEAEAAAEGILELVKTENCRIFQDENCFYRLGFDPEPDRRDPCLELNRKERAFRKSGLEAFLEVACQENAFYRYTPADQADCFSFQVVDQHFHLAKHPFQYNSIEDLEVIKDQLFTDCLQKNVSNITITTLSITSQGTPTEEQWVALLTNTTNGESIFNVGVVVIIPTKKEAELEALRALGYAGEKGYYYYDLDEKRLYLLSIKHTEDGFYADYDPSLSQYILAVRPSTSEDQLNELIPRLIELALHYPYTLRDQEFGFQLYCPAFSIEVPDDEDKCNPCLTESPCLPCPEETTSSPTKTITGVIAWISQHTYGSLEEAKCYFERFCELLQDRTNCRPVDLNCGPYTLEIVDPEAVLAYHPQCYKKESELEAAIERTLKCVNTEGLHLVEHILLRPRNEETDCADECLLPVRPDCGCPVEYELDDPDPCLDVEDNNEQNPCCKADDLQTATYIPGADPYSFIATVVLPAWSKPYTTSRAREWVQDLFHREAPAHLGLNFIWLSPREMCRFEACFRKWLLWLRGEANCERDFELCDFVECLLNLPNCPLPPPDEQEGNCSRKESVTVNISNFYIRALLSNRDHWRYNLNNLSRIFNIQGNLGNYQPELIPITDVGVFSETGDSELRVERATPSQATSFQTAVVETQLPAIEPEETTATTDTVADLESSSEKAGATPIDPKLVRKLISQRKKKYKASFAAISDKRMIRTEYYEHAQFLLETNGSVDSYLKMVEFFLEKSEKSKAKSGLSRYSQLLELTTHLILDHLVATDREKVQSKKALKQAWKSLKSKQIDLKAIAESWNIAELKETLQTKVSEEYVKLLKSIS